VHADVHAHSTYLFKNLEDPINIIAINPVMFMFMFIFFYFFYYNKMSQNSDNSSLEERTDLSKEELLWVKKLQKIYKKHFKGLKAIDKLLDCVNEKNYNKQVPKIIEIANLIQANDTPKGVIFRVKISLGDGTAAVVTNHGFSPNIPNSSSDNNYGNLVNGTISDNCNSSLSFIRAIKDGRGTARDLDFTVGEYGKANYELGYAVNKADPNSLISRGIVRVSFIYPQSCSV